MPTFEARSASASSRSGGFSQPCGFERKTWTQSAPRVSAAASGSPSSICAPTAFFARRLAIHWSLCVSPTLIPMPKKVLILGSTGSIGEQALDVVARSQELELAGLSAAGSWDRLVGGELVTSLAEATGAKILPVDSEHSALYQLVGAAQVGAVDRLVLTASGGPFRGRRDLSGVTPDEALAHPTWSMGARITIDCATLMNKGFEVIEAHHLFGVGYGAIDVVVHPQSIVHAQVQLADGASLAHLGHPDMRVPISYALHHPERADVPVAPLDLATVGELTFEEPDLEAFPCLRLAREAGEAGGTAPCVLNAADEVAVAAFLDGGIPFTAIPEVVADTLAAMPPAPPSHFEDLYAADAEARERARELCAVMA